MSALDPQGQATAESMTCPFCGGAVLFVDSAEIYHGRSYGMAYRCENWPGCNAYVGTHPGTAKPLGTLADGETRKWRQRVHAKLDRLWKDGPMKRSEVYAALAKYFNLPEVHIGESDIRRCIQIIQFAKMYLDEP